MRFRFLAVLLGWATTCAFGQGHPGQPATLVLSFAHDIPTDRMLARRTAEIPDYLKSDPTLRQIATIISSEFPEPTVAASFGETIAESETHLGADISVPVGTPIRALASGIVLETQYDEGFGNFLVIAHGNNLYSIYGHLSGFAGKHNGDKVSSQQIIGYAGVTGLTMEPAVHIAVVKDGQYIDPLLLPRIFLQKPNS